MFTAKKGQMEVMGLLVIVILLLFLGMIYLRFSVKGSNASLADVRGSIEASHLLSALLWVDLEEGSVKERILACSHDNTGCQTLTNDLVELFSVSLKKEEKYTFSVLDEDKNVLFEIGTCGRGVVTTYHFLEEGAFFEARLTLCRTSS